MKPNVLTVEQAEAWLRHMAKGRGCRIHGGYASNLIDCALVALDGGYEGGGGVSLETGVGIWREPRPAQTWHDLTPAECDALIAAEQGGAK